MKRGLLVPVIDRMIANVRAIREAPEAITLIAIVAVGIFYLVLEQFYSPRVTALIDRIATQERLLTDYRTKLKGATPDEAASQIDKLTSLLADAQKSQGVAKSKPASRETILLVEDDPDVRAYTTEILHELGYRIFEAQEGDTALSVLASEPDIQLLFTDIGLPGPFNGR
jgi:PleD family two-component response regulator